MALAATLGTVALASDRPFAEETTAAPPDHHGDGQGASRNNAAGAVFAMTNVTAGNEIITYSRANDGTLTMLNRRVRTRGLGIGVDTDTQGPLRLSSDNRFLYAVNASGLAAYQPAYTCGNG